MGYRARDGAEPVDPAHAEDEAGQVPLVQTAADTDVPVPAPGAPKPDEVTEDDGSGMAGGASGSSSGGSSMPTHPDAARGRDATG
ncbi:preprotein translocase YidC [Micromonospora aurantiaca]|uniref:preprotein translocase YidC n=1 Tax=Micromonospora aurantiaca (nom. illeg.) TaxID=47850 RepID=UPI0034364BE1